MTDPTALLVPVFPAEAERERVRVLVEDGGAVVVRDYLLTRRRALIMELDALNKALGIRRVAKDAPCGRGDGRG